MLTQGLFCAPQIISVGTLDKISLIPEYENREMNRDILLIS